MTDSEQFTPTPAAAWVDPHPAQDVVLPSGNRARIKKPNLYILGRSGQVPAKVEAAAERSKAPARPVEMTAQVVSERTEDVELFVDWVMTRAFLEPRVTLMLEDGAVPAAAISADDKSFVIETLGIEV